MPGKFEGEPSYVEHFWNLALEGGGESMFVADTMLSIFMPTTEDVAKFPLLGERGVVQLAVWERSDGFVCHAWRTTSDNCLVCGAPLNNGANHELCS